MPWIASVDKIGVRGVKTLSRSIRACEVYKWILDLDCDHGSFGAFPSYEAKHRLEIRFHVERKLGFLRELVIGETSSGGRLHFQLYSSSSSKLAKWAFVAKNNQQYKMLSTAHMFLIVLVRLTLDEFDLEEMDLVKWQLDMISIERKSSTKRLAILLENIELREIKILEEEMLGTLAIRMGEDLESELEKQPLYDRFVTAGGMHVVPPPMTGNYMPSGPDVEIDYSQFTYGPKQSQPSESETQTSDFDTCESDCSVETHESLPEPTLNEPKVVNQPKVRSDAPIIEEYESDSEDEHVSQPTKEQEQPSFASTYKQVKTPRETVKKQFTHSKNPTVNKKGLGYGFTTRGFKNRDFIELCGSKGIKREYSNARTPQQNGVAERKNMTLIEAARTMLADSFLPNTFWAEAVSTACLCSSIRSENQANKHAGPQEANHNAGIKDNIDAGNSEKEDESIQDYFALPIWSSYSSTVKRSTEKDAGEATNKHPDLQTDEKPVEKEDQVFLEELERLKRQEKDANDAAECS
ncbi:putative ribonuclease H-like domain-containing protein [Tanacetum coccineum]